MEYVDLGLPSGTLWAKCNLGAEKESDFGLFYQWGDTQGYKGVDRHQFSWDDYKYGNDDSITKYNNTDDKLVLDNEDDPVFAATNGKFSSPTKEQFEELRDHTNHEWIEIDGVNGMKFINKNDDTKYIFIPAAGDCSYGGHYDVGFWGSVWSASRDESGANFAWHIAFGAGGVGVYHYGRCYGFSVRGVVVPQAKTFDEIDDTDDGKTVDLGLPSGTKWMKSNIGATKPSDFGKFFQWGDTQGYSGVDEHQFDWSDYKYGTSWDNITKYNDTDQLTVLESSDDSAVAATGGGVSMPTRTQLIELIGNTEHRWLRLANGVNGMKFWKKGTEEPTDGNSYIFIPAAGYCSNGNHYDVGSWGRVWFASRTESSAGHAWSMLFNASDVGILIYGRCFGLSVRGVVVPQTETFDEIDDTDDGQPVDLGLPSGTKWMKSNIGATKPSDFGKFFQWGDTQGYEGVDEHQFNWDDYKYGSWDKLSKYNKTDNKLILDNEDDPVFVATDGKFSSPTKEQLQELIDCTNHEWTEVDGVNGIKFTNKKDAAKYIFIPATGYCYNGRHLDVGSWGGVWSTSHLGSDASYALYVGFDAGDVYMSSNLYRCLGYSVRGVVVPQAKTFDEIDDTDDGKPVDLGLPSGTKWMKSNIGATKPSEFGKFFQWGDTQGYEGVDEHQFYWSDYKYGTSWENITKYNDTDHLKLLEASDDAVTGGGGSMPTKDQLQELIDNTNHEWVRLENGVNGMKFVNKSDDTKYIFIPAAGYCSDSTPYDDGSWGYVWSASRDESSANYAWYMLFDAGVVVMNNLSRCYGYSVRGVVVPQTETFDEIDDSDDGQPVDLGLPSGTLWMKSNLGGDKPSDFGLFYQWADTEGYAGVDEHQFSWEDYKWGNYNSLTKYNNTDQLTLLESSDDSAVAATGGQPSMPTKAQLEELKNNTEHRWLRLANGVNGMKFWKKGTEEPTDGNSYIFIPAAGNCLIGSHFGVGSWGFVWSASRNESLANYAWGMLFSAGSVDMDSDIRCNGCSVRGVVAPQTDILDEIDDTDDGQPVDLGLPSGTLWMKSNLGGDKPSDFGLFYQWADTEGYAGVDEKTFSWSTYKYGTSWDNMTKYNNTDNKLVLDNDDDPVYTASSGQYKSPTQDQLQELMDNTVHQWVRLANGINGMKFVNRNDDTKYIFIPAAGLCYDSYHFHVDSWGCVWSSSRNSSNPSKAWSMDFDSGDVYMSNFYRCYGFSVRGVINSKNI